MKTTDCIKWVDYSVIKLINMTISTVMPEYLEIIKVDQTLSVLNVLHRENKNVFRQ